MQGVETVSKDGVDYAIIVRRSADSGEKHNFICPNHYAFQLGVNFYHAKDTIRTHAHTPREIRTTMFQELVLIAEGKAKLKLFDTTRRPLGEWLLEAGDLVLLIDGGHGFDVMEETKIIEVKQGPFHPSVNDKTFY